jgi:hypothetical protein
MTLKVALLFSLGVVLAGCFGQLTQGENDWLLVPGERAGLIQKNTSERLLVETFGLENVRREVIPQADGQELPGTVIFPVDPVRRIEIFWKDPSTRSSPSEVHVFGEKTHWRLMKEITLGTTLTDLERLNGRPFEIAGWGWDYGGIVCNWNGGSLDAILPIERLGSVVLYTEGFEDLAAVEQESLHGDSCHPSSLPLIRRLNPSVVFLSIRFAE